VEFEDVREIYVRPFSELVFEAQRVHRENFDPKKIQLSALLSVKTGACPEDCAYCPQSAHYNTGLAAEPLLKADAVVSAAKAAKAQGATRFCLGAAWRSPKDQDLEKVCEMVSAVKALGLETCATLGMLTAPQAERLKTSGLDFYNHNIDTSPDYYEKIITTRNFQDRLDTLEVVAESGMKVCCGGIIGMGESIEDRLQMLVSLSKLSAAPESIPLNLLIPIAGTPLGNSAKVDPLDFVRLVATTRILFPKSYVRLAAGRENMSEEFHALCFLAGANSVFLGERLLTAHNPVPEKDHSIFEKLGISAE